MFNVKHELVPRQDQATTPRTTYPTLFVVSSLAFVKAENYILVHYFSNLLKGARSRHFEVLWTRTKLSLNRKEPDNNSLLR